MTPDFEYPVAIRAQPAFEPAAPYGQRQLDVLGGQATRAPRRRFAAGPATSPRRCAICPAWRGPSAWPASAKDEGGRFGLGSFKALGGAYAVSRQLLRELAAGWAGTTCPWRICCPAAIAN